MFRKTAVATAALVAAVSLPACQVDPPCEKLAPPTQADIDAARGGSEVEREIGGAECVVVGDSWVDATDE